MHRQSVGAHAKRHIFFTEVRPRDEHRSPGTATRDPIVLVTDRGDYAVFFGLAEHVVAEIADRFLAAGVDENSGSVAVAGAPPPAVLGPVRKGFRPLSVLRGDISRGDAKTMKEVPRQ